MKRLTTSLILTAALLFATAPRAAAVLPPTSVTLSPLITQSTTNLLFYIYGLLDGAAEVEARTPDKTYILSLRQAGEMSLITANMMLTGTSSPTAYCYFLGRAHAYLNAANAADETPL